MREYVGVIWIADRAGVRLQLVAESIEDARARVVAEYGEGHVVSLWNEDDAASPRSDAERMPTEPGLRPLTRP